MDAALAGSDLGPLVPEPIRTTRFLAGDLVGNRYRVVRFLDRGGMGEVYEAEDTELGTIIALKCIALAHDPEGRTLARLRREVRLARKVTHPNVCRLIDLGFHVDGDKALAFLTMELVTGEPLSRHLERRGRLDSREALALAVQMARALDAVHKAGIIHRDFKSSNVMLSVADEGPRVVVMDFGVALPRADADDSGEPSITSETALVGSPAYMSPEQVTGERLTPASDVYALGVVLFQMTTGTLPFTAESALEAARMRLRVPPPSPRAIVASLDARWDRVIRRCLSRSPEDRFASPGAVASALTSPLGGIFVPRRTRQLLFAAGAACALGAWHFAAPPKAATEASVATQQARPHVAVLPFRDSTHDGSGETAWLSTSLAEMFAAELAAGDAVRVAPGDVIARALRDANAPQAALHVRDATGAALVLRGAYHVDGERLRLDVALLDPTSDRIAARLTSTGDVARPFALVREMCTDVRAKLGVSPPLPTDLFAAEATHAANGNADRLYAEGLERFRADDLAGARDRFVAATVADPSFALAHSELADVFRLLGHGADARAEAAKAKATGQALPRAARILLEGRMHAVANEWPAAADAYGALFKFFPDDVDHGLRFARAVLNAGRVQEAHDIVATLRRLPAPASNDARLDLVEALVMTKASDYRGCAARAADALGKAEATGSRSMVADAYEMLSEARQHLGDTPGAVVAATEARELYRELGNTRGLATVLEMLGDIYLDDTDPDRALASFEEALTLARAIGHEYRIASLQNRVGIARHLQGDLASARQGYERARAAFEALHEREGIGHTTMNLGVTWLDEGELGRARPLLEKALEALRDVGSRIGQTNARYYLGQLARAEGALKEARRDFEFVARDSDERGEKADAAGARLALARLSHDEGDDEQASRMAKEALAAYRKLDRTADVLETELVLARLALDHGDARGAEERARSVVSAVELRALKSLLLPALALRLRALVDLGRVAEANATADRALTEAREANAHMADRLEVSSAAALARAAAGQVDLAARMLEDARSQAEHTGHVGLALEARIAASRAIPKQRTLAVEIARDARAKGYFGLARRATPSALGAARTLPLADR